MAQPLGKAPDLSTQPHSFSAEVGHLVDAPPTGPDDHLTAAHPAQSNGRLELDRPVGVRMHSVRGVEVLEVTGRLHTVVEDLDRAIQLALAEGPRGVVCDLSAVIGGMESSAVEVLAAAGRHVRDWPPIPIAVASPNPQVHQGLAAHPWVGTSS